ncbi:Histone H2A.Z-specific chaperone [Steccherinum ochraceum]|uniref:Histone H2A.Z-specific chaperone n=1 Tax=Steccherinum ochraceum TaxID=92696 RepID=A0A4R0RIR3_9APHY|nr:Histone H2A.Z-specific chaperone [Steccherinum ochraceum]
MSSDATAPSTNDVSAAQDATKVDAPLADKGKGKLVQDQVMEDEEEDDEEEEDEEEEDDEMEEDNLDEIDTTAILAPGTRRSTRGARVDYSSAEALEKAGLKAEAVEEDEHEDSFVANEDDMKDD